MNINVKSPDYTVDIGAGRVPVRVYDAVVVGSGAAGFGCALALFAEGCRNIAIVTEGRMMGTSRNTGSDKQTYYKLADGDSAVRMANDMTAGGSMHGDLALVEAEGSARGFYRLVSLGVPFPHNEYGAYVGYRTDHDTAGRASSCGPLTSKFMTEALETSATEKRIPFYDGYRAVSIIKNDGGAAGILTVSACEANEQNRLGYAVFSAPHVVWAVGGPSAVYGSTVYPESQTCALGAALLAGARGINLTESQYGIASLSPRWNVSGSYQQVLPRYISTDQSGGDEREFLGDYISDPGDLLSAIFHKGYEWPFSAARIYDGGHFLSSAVDLAVFAERERGRRVFLDFTREPRELCPGGETDLSIAGAEAETYLENCGCRGKTPIERLREMNEPAIELYASRGVDLYREPLEISVCAQHCNGGIEVDKWYETRVPGLYVIGEAAGVFGVARPGGSALNSTQVGGIRAAERISHSERRAGKLSPEDVARGADLGSGKEAAGLDEILARRKKAAREMTACCSFLRRSEAIEAMRDGLKSRISELSELRAETPRELSELYITRDVMVTQLAMLASASAYISDGGKSRGAYLITDMTAEEVLCSRVTPNRDAAHSGLVLVTETDNGVDFECGFEPCRPVPGGKYWFETVYREYRMGEIYEK